MKNGTVKYFTSRLHTFFFKYTHGEGTMVRSKYAYEVKWYTDKGFADFTPESFLNSPYDKYYEIEASEAESNAKYGEAHAR